MTTTAPGTTTSVNDLTSSPAALTTNTTAVVDILTSTTVAQSSTMIKNTTDNIVEVKADLVEISEIFKRRPNHATIAMALADELVEPKTVDDNNNNTESVKKEEQQHAPDEVKVTEISATVVESTEPSVVVNEVETKGTNESNTVKTSSATGLRNLKINGSSAAGAIMKSPVVAWFAKKHAVVVDEEEKEKQKETGEETAKEEVKEGKKVQEVEEKGTECVDKVLATNEIANGDVDKVVAIVVDKVDQEVNVNNVDNVNNKKDKKIDVVGTLTKKFSALFVHDAKLKHGHAHAHAHQEEELKKDVADGKDAVLEAEDGSKVEAFLEEDQKDAVEHVDVTNTSSTPAAVPATTPAPATPSTAVRQSKKFKMPFFGKHVASASAHVQEVPVVVVTPDEDGKKEEEEEVKKTMEVVHGEGEVQVVAAAAEPDSVVVGGGGEVEEKVGDVEAGGEGKVESAEEVEESHNAVTPSTGLKSPIAMLMNRLTLRRPIKKSHSEEEPVALVTAEEAAPADTTKESTTVEASTSSSAHVETQTDKPAAVDVSESETQTAAEETGAVKEEVDATAAAPPTTASKETKTSPLKRMASRGVLLFGALAKKTTAQHHKQQEEQHEQPDLEKGTQVEAVGVVDASTSTVVAASETTTTTTTTTTAKETKETKGQAAAAQASTSSPTTSSPTQMLPFLSFLRRRTHSSSAESWAKETVETIVDAVTSNEGEGKDEEGKAKQGEVVVEEEKGAAVAAETPAPIVVDVEEEEKEKKVDVESEKGEGEIVTGPVSVVEAAAGESASTPQPSTPPPTPVIGSVSKKPSVLKRLSMTFGRNKGSVVARAINSAEVNGETTAESTVAAAAESVAAVVVGGGSSDEEGEQSNEVKEGESVVTAEKETSPAATTPTPVAQPRLSGLGFIRGSNTVLKSRKSIREMVWGSGSGTSASSATTSTTPVAPVVAKPEDCEKKEGENFEKVIQSAETLVLNGGSERLDEIESSSRVYVETAGGEAGEKENGKEKATSPKKWFSTLNGRHGHGAAAGAGAAVTGSVGALSGLFTLRRGRGKHVAAEVAAAAAAESETEKPAGEDVVASKEVSGEVVVDAPVGEVAAVVDGEPYMDFDNLKCPVDGFDEAGSGAFVAVVRPIKAWVGSEGEEIGRVFLAPTFLGRP
ncbi:hypothetical protein HDU76_003861 [Blyttiomyces sp. JEL0837]|nr:hypothetical protein HDU76_003861 [Blyttiomyces sp. JEL0837]